MPPSCFPSLRHICWTSSVRRIRSAAINKGGALTLALTLGLASIPTPAQASDTSASQTGSKLVPCPVTSSTEAKLLATAAAVVPGALVHGSGHLVLGQGQVAERLLLMQAGGLGLFMLGGVPIVMTGASKYVVGPGALLVIGGVSLFAASWLADIYGIWAPEGGVGQPAAQPRLTTELGYRYVYDPVFQYRHFSRLGFELWLDRVRLEPSFWFSLDERNSRLRALAAYQLLVPRTEPHSNSGSHLDLEAGLTHHDFSDAGFRVLIAEASLGGRLDLDNVHPRLAGTYWGFRAGLGNQSFDFSNSDDNDAAELLLARFELGIYLGGASARGAAGEIGLYYDHRHDDYAAGLKLAGLGSGVAGHFGLTGRYFWEENWGALVDLQAGSAYVAGLSVLYRYGQR